MIVLLAIAVFVATACVDFAHGRYIGNFVRGRAHGAARWSSTQIACASVGFVLAVKFTLWLVPFEIAGTYVGTWAATKWDVANRPRG